MKGLFVVSGTCQRITEYLKTGRPGITVQFSAGHDFCVGRTGGQQ